MVALKVTQTFGMPGAVFGEWDEKHSSWPNANVMPASRHNSGLGESDDEPEPAAENNVSHILNMIQW